MKLRTLLIPYAILLCGILVWVLAGALEWKETTETFPPSPEARKDPFLLLSRAWETRGRVIRLPGTDDGARFPEGGVAIVTGERLENRDPQELAEWIARGGCLVLSVPQEWQLPSGEGWDVAWTKGAFGGLVPEWTGEEEDLEDQDFLYWKAGQNFGPMAGGTIPKEGLLPEDLAASGGRGIMLVVRTWGQGRLVVCGSLDFLMNDGLRQSCNRETAVILAGNWHERAAPLLCDPPESLPTAPEMLDPATAEALSWLRWAVLAFCMILAWNRLPRRGPIREHTEVPRASLGERFRAEGIFLWRNGGRHLLLDAFRRGRSVHDADGNQSNETTPVPRDVPGVGELMDLTTEVVRNRTGRTKEGREP